MLRDDRDEVFAIVHHERGDARASGASSLYALFEPPDGVRKYMRSKYTGTSELTGMNKRRSMSRLLSSSAQRALRP